MAKKFIQNLKEKDVFEGAKFFEHENIKSQIVIVSDLESLIPPLSEEEFSQLEQNILKEGCREALQIWATTENIVYANGLETPIYVLVDGHNRYAICKKNNLDFQVHLVAFNTLDDAKEFMIDNQLGRRNLSPEQMSYFRGLKYLTLRIEKGKYDRDHKGKIFPYGITSTAELLAKEFNVSEKTIKNDAKFAESVDKLPKEIRKSVLQRSSTLTKAQVIEMGKLPNATQQIEELERNIPTLQKNTKTPIAKIIDLIRELTDAELDTIMNEINLIKNQNN